MSLDHRSVVPTTSSARRTLGDDLAILFGIAAFLIAARITERIIDFACAARTIFILPRRPAHTPTTNPNSTTNVLRFSTEWPKREDRSH